MQKHPDHKNIILATVLSFIILLAWGWFYEKPRIDKIEAEKNTSQAVNNQSAKTDSSKKKSQPNSNDQVNKIENDKEFTGNTAENIIFKSREDIISQSVAQRIKINTKALHGSILLKGARFDDITLVDYFEKVPKPNQENKEVVLFSPSESKTRYFADFGWISSDKNIDLPNPNTLWTSSSKVLTADQEIILTWRNKQNIDFIIKIAIDDNYMFSIKQIVKNNSKNTITLASYGRVNRILNNIAQSNYILHEGAIGSVQGILHEKKYEDLIEEKNLSLSNTNLAGSWLGITDKYWLGAIIPDKNLDFNAKFSYENKAKNNFFSVDFIGDEVEIKEKDELKLEHNLFAGAKKVRLLDDYSHKFNLNLFDRSIDFGWFYFLTKPFFFIIDFFNKFFGNFGLAIICMTILIKLALFPMANKSYEAIAKMKTLQPKIDALRQRFKDDKIAINREMMELYKREKINPASGCLPVLIQIPVFFALYKVLFVTLDMRHAQFYGWIKDLSAPDPTSIFNLFGLLPFQVSQSFTIGIWPILMGVTMVIQHRLSPPSNDPTQAKILRFMPYVLTFVLASFPAGLVIYWTWSNLLSIVQQIYINKKLKSK
ncbi:MAG: membrane protein insertase YidC [Alphaproteobacteria bacterium]